MNTSQRLLFGLGLGLAIAGGASAAEMGTAFTYQGFLEDGGGPVTATCDFEFSLWDADAAGTEEDNSPQSANGVDVEDGVFSVTIDFGSGAFNGNARWLEIMVCCPTTNCALESLDPRVELTPAPHAIRALEGVGPPNALEVNAGGQVGIGSPPNQGATAILQVAGGAKFIDFIVSSGPISTTGTITSGDTITVGGTPGADGIMFPDGTLQTTSALAGGGGDGHSLDAADGSPIDAVFVDNDGNVGVGTSTPGEALDVDGNIHASGTITSGNSISIDGINDQILSPTTLEFHVGGARALRLEPSADSPNLIGGYSGNSVTGGAVGATIGGGGSIGLENEVTASYGTVSGGQGNKATFVWATVGGGFQNTAGGDYATVGGGQLNVAGHLRATIDGGFRNKSTGNHASIGGGYNNYAGSYASVGGGDFNDASGFYSSIAGGQRNTATNYFASVGGGQFNDASGFYSSIGGGSFHMATGNFTTVAGGNINTASGSGAAIGGGEGNIASAFRSTVPGGQNNTAGGSYSLAAGLQATVRDDVASGDSNGDEGTFVWCDSNGNTDDRCTSTGPDQFIIRADGGVGIGTTTPASPLHVVSQSTEFKSSAIRGHSTGAEGIAQGVWGLTDSPSGNGVWGEATATTGGAWGVLGTSESTSGEGVHGIAYATTGPTFGVWGESNSTTGTGVYGVAGATSGFTSGVVGQSGSTSGFGVYGVATATSGDNYGVRGDCESTEGHGVLGWALATSGTNFGVRGSTKSPDGFAGYFTGPSGSSNYFQQSVGIGTNSPEGKLDVRGKIMALDTNGSNLVIREPGSPSAANVEFVLSHRGNGTETWMYGYNGTTFRNFQEWDYAANAVQFPAGGNTLYLDLGAGRVGIGTSSPGFPLEMGSGAHVTAGGAWMNASSRDRKENFKPVDALAVLDALAELPIGAWNYKNEDDSIRHVGPMAEDFAAAFHLGASDKHIGTIDADGVALAAIKGLYEIVQEKDCEIDELRLEKDAQIAEQDTHIADLQFENAAIKNRLARIEALLVRINAASQGGAR